MYQESIYTSLDTEQKKKEFIFSCFKKWDETTQDYNFPILPIFCLNIDEIIILECLDDKKPLNKYLIKQRFAREFYRQFNLIKDRYFYMLMQSNFLTARVFLLCEIPLSRPKKKQRELLEKAKNRLTQAENLKKKYSFNLLSDGKTADYEINEKDYCDIYDFIGKWELKLNG